MHFQTDRIKTKTLLNKGAHHRWRGLQPQTDRIKTKTLLNKGAHHRWRGLQPRPCYVKVIMDFTLMSFCILILVFTGCTSVKYQRM